MYCCGDDLRDEICVVGGASDDDAFGGKSSVDATVFFAFVSLLSATPLAGDGGRLSSSILVCLEVKEEMMRMVS